MVYTDFGVRLLYLYSVYVTIGPRGTRKTALNGRNRTYTGFKVILGYVFYTNKAYKLKIRPRRKRKTALKGKNRTFTGFILIWSTSSKPIKRICNNWAT